MAKSKLTQQLLLDYSDFSKEFDLIVRDSFQGVKLEQVAKAFFNKHKKELSEVEFASEYKFPQCNYQETLQEDLSIVNSDVGQQTNVDVNSILADIYRRVCQATHLRVTFNKSRFDLEEDRAEAPNFARHAIRYDPNNYEACLWFMISK